MNYLDWIIVAVLLLGAWRGYRRGGLNTFTGLLAYLAGLWVAAAYARPLADLLEQGFGIVSATGKRLAGILPITQPAGTSGIKGLSTGELSRAMESMGLPGFLRERLLELLPEIDAPTLGQAVSYGLASILIQALAFVVLVLLVVFAARLVSGMITRGISHTMLGTLNRVSGMLLGVTLNVVVLAVLFGLAGSFLVPRGASGGGALAGLAKSMDNSVLVPYMVQVFAIISDQVLKLF